MVKQKPLSVSLCQLNHDQTVLSFFNRPGGGAPPGDRVFFPNSGLEASSTDVANEFTEMIKTQRGYQANTRIITVTDSMLEELVNMKR